MTAKTSLFLTFQDQVKCMFSQIVRLMNDVINKILFFVFREEKVFSLLGDQFRQFWFSCGWL